jgi:hypothetical protein
MSVVRLRAFSSAIKVRDNQTAICPQMLRNRKRTHDRLVASTHSDKAGFVGFGTLSLESREMNKRDSLIAQTEAQGFPAIGCPLPVVPLEVFFEGNDDIGSIGCNLNPHPGIRFFFEHLLSIRSRPDVQDVLVEIYEIEEDEPESWPYSERIYILTSASATDVAEWMKRLRPDEIEEGYLMGEPPAAPELAEGMRVYGAWWD